MFSVSAKHDEYERDNAVNKENIKNLSGQQRLDHYKEGKFEDVDIEFCPMCHDNKVICLGKGCKGKEKLKTSKNKTINNENENNKNVVGLSEAYKIAIPSNFNPDFVEAVPIF